jgi:RNA polymerase sigma-70 factor (ECF subfamily)
VYLNDQKAARNFFNEFYQPLISFSMMYTDSVEMAEDVVSDVFLKLFKNKKRLLKIRDIRLYLYKSVKNQTYTHLKRRKNNVQVDADPKMEEFVLNQRTPEGEYLSQELRDAVQRVIRRLPKKRRLVYQLVTEDKLKYREVAELLDISTKTVNNHMTLAVQDLRKHVEAYLHGNMMLGKASSK